MTLVLKFTDPLLRSLSVTEGQTDYADSISPGLLIRVRIRSKTFVCRRAIVETTLLKKWAVAPKAGGTGFKLQFWPGTGFFEDYGGFYRSPVAAISAGENADVRGIQQPHELVAYFHDRRGHSATMFVSVS